MEKVIWWIGFWTVFIWSAIAPKDYPTWFLEVLPALIAAGLVFFTRKSFPLTPLLFWWILVHCIILMVGGHYTYAEVPLFDHIAELFGSQRNNYDKVGHFAQGFVPALLAREILLRKRVINGRGWLNFLVVALCLGISAFYELIEWWVAVLSETGAEAFLGMQGYVWDTQSDMLLALIGATSCLVILSRKHDQQLARLADGGQA